MSSNHEVNVKITRTRRKKANKVFFIPVVHEVEVRAKSAKDAEAILNRSEWKVSGPQDTKNGVYLIRQTRLVEFEEIVNVVLSQMAEGFTEDMTGDDSTDE